MKKYRHEFLVNCEIQKAWDFFTDPKHFDAITPKNLNETLIRSSGSRLVAGTDVSKQMRVIDEITFEFGFSLIGKILESIVLAKLGPIFQYREYKTKEILQT